MNEEIRKSYPGLKSEKDYNKLLKMLTYQKIHLVCSVVGVALGCVFVLLGKYTEQSIYCIISVAILFITLALSAIIANKVDEIFVANAKREPIVQKNTLNITTILRKIEANNRTKKKSSVSIIIWWSFIMLGFAVYQYCRIDDYDLFQPIFYLVIIPNALKLLFDAFSRRLYENNIKKITNEEYKLIKTKLAYKTVSEIGGDTTSEYYYLCFDCKEYGTFMYEVSKEKYLCSNKRKDIYYLLIIPQKKGKKYTLVEIFSAEKWNCSDELKNVIEIDIDAKVILNEKSRQIDVLAVELFDGDMQKTIKYIVEEEPPETSIYLKKMTAYEKDMFYEYFAESVPKNQQNQ